jgi:hypothetical protein
MVIDAKFFGLMVGDRSNARQASCAHVLDYDSRVTRR